MNQLVPLYIGSGVFGLLFVLMPCFVKKGPNQGIIQCSMLLAVFSMWIFWATVYISQMNPLVGPRHRNSTLIFMKYKQSGVKQFPIKSGGGGGEVAKTPPVENKSPAPKFVRSQLRERPDHCLDQPDNVFECCSIPWLPPRARVKCIPGQVNVFKLNCAEARCAFQEEGWLIRGELNLALLNAYYDDLVQTNREWSEAVRLIKTQCLQINPKFQSVYTNCIEFDIMYCALIRMLKYGPLENWSTAAACAATKQFTATCPICPEECSARDLGEYPENVCRACIMV